MFLISEKHKKWQDPLSLEQKWEVKRILFQSELHELQKNPICI